MFHTSHHHHLAFSLDWTTGGGQKRGGIFIIYLSIHVLYYHVFMFPQCVYYLFVLLSSCHVMSHAGREGERKL